MLDTLSDGDVLLADTAYDSDSLRVEMSARGAKASIKPMSNRKKRPVFGAFLYTKGSLSRPPAGQTHNPPFDGILTIPIFGRSIMWTEQRRVAP